MYQINVSNGYQIQVIGKGDNGLSRVVNSNGKIMIEGGYDVCAKWLQNRGVSLKSRGDGRRNTSAMENDNR